MLVWRQDNGRRDGSVSFAFVEQETSKKLKQSGVIVGFFFFFKGMTPIKNQQKDCEEKLGWGKKEKLFSLTEKLQIGCQVRLSCECVALKYKL